ncbi:MAG: IS21 family transposase [Acidobacteriota bacterium]|nr:IS21 family transposase [Acidobacteriota bacterium]
MPSEVKEPRSWRTREDPFAEDWPAVAQRLAEAPELEAKVLFEDLLSRLPERYEAGQMRTFQRRVKEWRAQQGPPKEVFFAQEHRPGEALQSDFTWAKELAITIGGEPFPHQLCHVVLPYSNWSWPTVCFSESLSALRHGVQAAVFKLGRVAVFHQTDNSTAATHDLRTGKRGFNAEYEALMRHLGMEPRTIEPGQKHQNGDVEALNGALKRRLEQHLLLRGGREFGSQEAYEAWLGEVMEKANRLRSRRLAVELEAMRPVRVERLAEYTEVEVGVSGWSTIRIKRNAYSVPSRLMGERVRVRIFEAKLEVLYNGRHQLTIERRRGEGGHRIDYRHIIWSLVRKPGAFARYRYREELFPTPAFRRAYDRLHGAQATPRADLEYLRILHLAASTMEAEVEAALELLGEEVPLYERVKSLVQPARPPAVVPEVPVPVVDLHGYDVLLTQVAS